MIETSCELTGVRGVSAGWGPRYVAVITGRERRIAVAGRCDKSDGDGAGTLRPVRSGQTDRTRLNGPACTHINIPTMMTMIVTHCDGGLARGVSQSPPVLWGGEGRGPPVYETNPCSVRQMAICGYDEVHRFARHCQVPVDLGGI